MHAAAWSLPAGIVLCAADSRVCQATVGLAAVARRDRCSLQDSATSVVFRWHVS